MLFTREHDTWARLTVDNGVVLQWGSVLGRAGGGSLGKKGPVKSGCVDNGEVANSGSDPVAGRAAESGQVENQGGDPVVAIMVAGGCGMMGGSGDCVMVSGNGNSGDVMVGHKGLNLWAISYSKGGCLLELQDCVELDV